MKNYKIGAAYIRVSTDDQTEFSPDSQRKAIIEYAKKNNIILNEEYIFVEDGISGKSVKKRPEFNRMIGLAKTKPKPFDVILLWKFSRFARNREDSIVYKSMLRKQYHIDVVSITENVGDDKMSILIEAMIEAMDEFYSINLSEEVKRGMTEKAHRGQPQTTAPFGYKMVNKNFEIVPEEAKIIQMIFDNFLAGEALHTMARNLKTLGIRTHRGSYFENRTIEYILRNPVYKGYLRWTPTGKIRRDFKNPDSIIQKGTHQPIITEEQFEEANIKLDTQKRLNAKHYKPKTNESHFLCGFIRCGECGKTLVKSGPHSYQCNGYVHGTCYSHSITIKKLEDIIIESLINIRDKTSTGIYNIEVISKGNTDTNEHIKVAISKLELKLKRITEAYQAGIDTLEEYKQNKTEINKELSLLKSKIKISKKPKFNHSKFAEIVNSAINTINSINSTNAEKSAALKSFVKKITYYKKDNSFFFDLYYEEK